MRRRRTRYGNNSLQFSSLTTRHCNNSASPYELTTAVYSYDTIRYDTICYFDVRSKADMSQLNLPHATDNYTHPFNCPLSGTSQVSLYQKDKTNLDFTEARDSEWQWHQLAVCKSALSSRQITMPAPHHCFLRAGCPSCRPTNSVKALKATALYNSK